MRLTYAVAPYGESHTELGVLYRVEADYEKCGCGEVEMKATVGYFPLRENAEQYAVFLNQSILEIA